MPDRINYQQFLNNVDINAIFEKLSPIINDQESYRFQQSFYTPEDFTKMLNVHTVDKYLEKQFSCLHINCRSIKKTFLV